MTGVLLKLGEETMQPELRTEQKNSCIGLQDTTDVTSVLYLDDDEIDRTLMQMHVKRHLKGGVELQLAETICEARDALASGSFDYLVIDNRIPPVQDYRETLDLLDLGGFSGRIVVVSSETRFDCFDSRCDPRVHCVTDKSDLSKAIRDGLFS